MFKFFRGVALFEGITTIALFLIAMPAKYMFDFPHLVPFTGQIHGFAFVAYLIVMVVAFWGKPFTALDWLRTTFAAIIPFGTFLNHNFLKQKQQTHDLA